ncbi:uncharacterized protein BT62DRAFT_1011602 [Guyanagaster necrorhizus]|uniref:Protein kinase domain-containing protein n=1 Tax=Guyanagaster necrorhizus TaxID=856835 RepID=A0A9P7VIW0_9AGAR|nr:uncharacterized protein BT62DRAFT_1011602 [Guyanagaster necrorhizus MCA 3950]KAG7441355.1 hypothetical protein BT62DRAFT_1011602 [Guyanagaster necrorhizus MCA 3950]
MTCIYPEQSFTYNSKRTAAQRSSLLLRHQLFILTLADRRLGYRSAGIGSNIPWASAIEADLRRAVCDIQSGAIANCFKLIRDYCNPDWPKRKDWEDRMWEISAWLWKSHDHDTELAAYHLLCRLQGTIIPRLHGVVRLPIAYTTLHPIIDTIRSLALDKVLDAFRAIEAENCVLDNDIHIGNVVLRDSDRSPVINDFGRAYVREPGCPDREWRGNVEGGADTQFMRRELLDPENGGWKKNVTSFVMPDYHYDKPVDFKKVWMNSEGTPTRCDSLSTEPEYASVRSRKFSVMRLSAAKSGLELRSFDGIVPTCLHVKGQTFRAEKATYIQPLTRQSSAFSRSSLRKNLSVSSPTCGRLFASSTMANQAQPRTDDDLYLPGSKLQFKFQAQGSTAFKDLAATVVKHFEPPTCSVVLLVKRPEHSQPYIVKQADRRLGYRNGLKTSVPWSSKLEDNLRQAVRKVYAGAVPNWFELIHDREKRPDQDDWEDWMWEVSTWNRKLTIGNSVHITFCTVCKGVTFHGLALEYIPGVSMENLKLGIDVSLCEAENISSKVLDAFHAIEAEDCALRRKGGF